MSKLERDVVGMLAIKAVDLLQRALILELPASAWEKWRLDVGVWLEDYAAIEGSNAAGAKTEPGTCDECCYFHRYPQPNTQGMCYRYPPPGDDGFPVVSEKNWCGEFQKKEATT